MYLSPARRAMAVDQLPALPASLTHGLGTVGHSVRDASSDMLRRSAAAKPQKSSCRDGVESTGARARARTRTPAPDVAASPRTGRCHRLKEQARQPARYPLAAPLIRGQTSPGFALARRARRAFAHSLLTAAQELEAPVS